jgi:hypothetical protein
MIEERRCERKEETVNMKVCRWSARAQDKVCGGVVEVFYGHGEVRVREKVEASN